MDITDHKGEHPVEVYQQHIATLDPQEIAARTDLTYDEGAQTFMVTLLGRPVATRWPDLATTYQDTGEETPNGVRILMACLLSHGRLIPGTGKFLSYNQVPSGDHYFKPFEGRCLKRLAFMFKSAEQFAAACEACGGKRVKGGDAAYEFAFIANPANDQDTVYLQLIVWEGDDEFPPNAQILFSDNVSLALTAEELAAAGDIILGALKRARTD